MERRSEFADVLQGEVSEDELGSIFREKLENFGERIEFKVGERPVGNFFRGRGMVRTMERIGRFSGMVVETDRLGKDPFNIFGKIIVWRKVFSGEDEELPIGDFPGLYEPFIEMSGAQKGSSIIVKMRLPWNDMRTIGYFPEAGELLNAWIEGRRLPEGW